MKPSREEIDGPDEDAERNKIVSDGDKDVDWDNLRVVEVLRRTNGRAAEIEE